MDIICAWCEKKLGEKEGDGITHGICDDCLLHYFPHEYEKVKSIEGIPESKGKEV